MKGKERQNKDQIAPLSTELSACVWVTPLVLLVRLGGLGVHFAPYQVPVPDHQEQVHQHGWQVDVPGPDAENDAQLLFWGF